MLQFDEPSLTATLRRLPISHRVAFAARCARRSLEALPATEPAQAELLAIVDDLCAEVVGGRRDLPFLEALLARCVALLPPEVEDDDEIAPDAADREDAAAATAYAIRAYLLAEPHDATMAGQLAYDLADRRALEQLGKGAISVIDRAFEERVDASPEIQEELGAQQRDLAELTALTDKLCTALAELLRVTLAPTAAS